MNCCTVLNRGIREIWFLRKSVKSSANISNLISSLSTKIPCIYLSDRILMASTSGQMMNR